MSSSGASSPQSPARPQAPATAGGASSSAGAKRRKRAKKNATASAAASSTQPHGHSHGSGPHHGHSHGGGQHHGHSHDGVPCSGHGAPEILTPFGDVDNESMSEAVHYVDCCFHYQSYSRHSFARIERLHSDFQIMPTTLQTLVPTFAQRMQSLREAVVANHAFVNEILRHRDVFHNTPEINYDALEQKVAREHPVDEERMSRVRSTIRQCVRDWSAEGAEERDACYGPILRELERIYPTMESRKGVKVLVPGSGLGRLVWECAARGFEALGNEFSYFMLMCSFLILNCCKAKEVFTIYPYCHESKNLIDPADALRAVRIPDVNPMDTPAQGQLSYAAGDWMDIFSDLPTEYLHGAFRRKGEKERRRTAMMREKQKQWNVARLKRDEEAKKAAAAGLPPPPPLAVEDEPEEFIPDPPRAAGPDSIANKNGGKWDVFASCYFIDCATNILEFIRTIAYVLKPGGHWINFGPLLYHYSDVPTEVSVDLSWKELRAAIPYFGLELVSESLNNPSLYTSDSRSMLRQQYFCISCTWKKTGEDVTSKPLTSRPTLAEPVSVAWESRTEANGVWSTIAIDAANETATQHLTVLMARLVRTTTTPSGAPIAVWQIPASKLGAFLLKAMESEGIKTAKLVLDGVEMLALLQPRLSHASAAQHTVKA